MSDVIQLMIPPFVAGMVILSIHAYLGLHVIARGVIFVDLAFAQVAALGTTVGLLMGVEHGTPLSLVFAFGFTLFGALIFSFSRMEHSIVPQEAIIGITYVVASAAVILLAGLTAEGAEHIRETLTGTLIWVGWPEIVRMAVVYAGLGAFYYIFRRRLLAASFGRSTNERSRRWDFLFYVSFGVAISLSVSVAGVLLVFSLLVIPAVIAFLFTNRFFSALLLAWVTGTVALVLGLVASFVLDIATGPLLVVAYGAILVVAFVVRAVMKADAGETVRL